MPRSGVLGDRRLTFNWGGSVLDSVVGVFLTQVGRWAGVDGWVGVEGAHTALESSSLLVQHAKQHPGPPRPLFPTNPHTYNKTAPCPQNVADHLSSRAYMELASRFPVRRRQQLMEGADSVASGPADIASEGGGAADGGWTAQEDSVDWEAVRTASHADLSDAIKCRGMQFRQAGPPPHPTHTYHYTRKCVSRVTYQPTNSCCLRFNRSCWPVVPAAPGILPPPRRPCCCHL